MEEILEENREVSADAIEAPVENKQTWKEWLGTDEAIGQPEKL